MAPKNVMLVEKRRTVVLRVKIRILCCLLAVFLFAGPCRVSASAQEPLLPEEAAWTEPLLLEKTSALQTIARVKALPAGTMGVCFRGCVVWAGEQGLIVQDDTDSIRLLTEGDFQTGDGLLVSGQTGEDGFFAEDVTFEGTGALPARLVDSLVGLPEGLRVRIPEVSLSAGLLTKDGCALRLVADTLPEGTAEVWGIAFGDTFYADTIIPIAAPEREWKAFFGLLDAHTSLSDGLGTPQEAYARAREEGLDFFALTEHSDSLDNAGRGEITLDGTTVSAEWALGKQAAADAATADFVGFFGFEMSWGEDHRLGHINTFATPGWQTPRQSGMDTLAGYCAALAKVPGSVSQFNHPGMAYGSFGDFQPYDPACDDCIQLLQVEGEGGESFYCAYLQALDAGWHVAPTVGQDNHHGNWGAEGQSRTAVLAKSLSEQALYEAMGARRVYATQDCDLYIDYRLNGNLMGSVMGVTQGLEASVAVDDPTDGNGCAVEIIGTGGAVLASGQTDDGALTLSVPDGWPYYFLRITQPDGDTAVTAPVWVDDYQDLGISDFSADTDSPLTGQRVNLTLTLYHWEEAPLEVTAAELYWGEQKLGDFTPAGALRYTFPLSWETPGEVRLTAVVQAVVDGQARGFEEELILHFGVPEPVRATIRQARGGSPGGVYTVEGYATSGNTNPYTTFPNTIYVQDATGGIPVKGTFSEKIQIGTPLQITGVLRSPGGERYLELTDCQLPEKSRYRYVSPILSCREATDYAQRGGSLVRVQGTVTERTLTEDGLGVTAFTLRDSRGDTARIVIDPEIRSGAYGFNHLASVVQENGTVRVSGLLTMTDTGQAALRVRNCDEVVAVRTAASRAGIADESNPKTGDGWFLRWIADFLW